MIPFATLQDLEDRHPAELIILAADEATGIRDDIRALAALRDASAEVRGILKARYSAAELENLDAESRGTVRIYVMDIALYRISLAFSRRTDALEERYRVAIKRLEGIVAGKGALSFAAPAGEDGLPGPTSTASPNEVLIDVPERMFTRQRTRCL